MDLGTIIGLIAALTLLTSAMALSVGLGPYIDVPSMFIVIGGSVSSLFIGFKLEQMKNFFKIFMVAIKPTKENVPQIVANLVEYATQARKEGILALETAANNEENKFLKTGLTMAVDGNEPDTIRELLEIEIEQTNQRHLGNSAIFSEWANFAGSMGMIGTLIGLVAMLLNMSDPSAIGPAMAIALLTTMYGAIISNVFANPIANLLNIRNKEETLVKQMILEGIMSIQAGDNPRHLETKLLSFLPPKERVSQYE